MFTTVTKVLFEGFGTTVELFALTLLFALPLGLLFSFGSMSKIKPVKWIMKVFVWVIRGTPLMLQLIVIFYGPGLIGQSVAKFINSGEMMEWIGSWSTMGFLKPVVVWFAKLTINIFEWLATWHNFDRFIAVLVAFVINYACYFSEIFRGGIESISKGQYEAGQVLGMTKTQVFFRVILLQVIKRIIPPMSNEIITLVKDTSLARTISVYEIIWVAESFSKSAGLIWPLFYTAAFYLIFCGLLTVLFGKLEKKLSYFRS